jgi:hypothetical protein
MTVRKWIAAALLASLAPSVSNAATEANFDARSTGDLVALCSAAPDNGLGTAALNFCEGYIEGAVTVETLNLAGFRGPKLYCLANPPPTRAATMSGFVSWAQAAPDRMAQSATDGLFGFLRERYPCPSSH